MTEAPRARARPENLFLTGVGSLAMPAYVVVEADVTDPERDERYKAAARRP